MPAGRTRHRLAAMLGLCLACLPAVQADARRPRHAPVPALLTEDEARRRAVAILLGEPYGRTDAEVDATLREVALVRSGQTACGEVWRPVWSVHVVVPARRLDGTLLLDGSTGAKVCATLPYLD